MHGNVTRTMQETQRPLLTPDSVCAWLHQKKKMLKARLPSQVTWSFMWRVILLYIWKQPFYFQILCFLRGCCSCTGYSDKIIQSSWEKYAIFWRALLFVCRCRYFYWYCFSTHWYLLQYTPSFPVGFYKDYLMNQWEGRIRLFLPPQDGFFDMA